MANRKSYTDEQKAEILKKAEEKGVAAAVKEYGVSRVTIASWKAKATLQDTEKKAEQATAAVKEEVQKGRGRVKKAAEAVKDAAAAAEIEGKKTVRRGGRKVKEAAQQAALKAEDAKDAVVDAVIDTAAKVEDAVAAQQIEVEKAKAKGARKTKETADKVKQTKAAVEKAVKTPGRKVKAAKMSIVIQSPFGHEIVTEEIAAKLPKGVESVYVRVDQNKLYWVKGDENGSVEIWED